MCGVKMNRALKHAPKQPVNKEVSPAPTQSGNVNTVYAPMHPAPNEDTVDMECNFEDDMTKTADALHTATGKQHAQQCHTVKQHAQQPPLKNPSHKEASKQVPQPNSHSILMMMMPL